jgi:hypothetical protein
MNCLGQFAELRSARRPGNSNTENTGGIASRYTAKERPRIVICEAGVLRVERLH